MSFPGDVLQEQVVQRGERKISHARAQEDRVLSVEERNDHSVVIEQHPLGLRVDFLPLLAVDRGSRPRQQAVEGGARPAGRIWSAASLENL